MAIIDQYRNLCTVFQTIKIDAEKGDELTLYRNEVVAPMKMAEGLISVNLHLSTDGMAVTNYMQWRSQKDFEVFYLSLSDEAKDLLKKTTIAQEFTRVIQA